MSMFAPLTPPGPPGTAGPLARRPVAVGQCPEEEIVAWRSLEGALVCALPRPPRHEPVTPTAALWQHSGLPGKAGLPVPRPVDQGLKRECGIVTLPSVEGARVCARQTDRSLMSVTHRTAQLMHHGPLGRAGHPVAKPVGEGSRADPEVAEWPSTEEAQQSAPLQGASHGAAAPSAVLPEGFGAPGVPGAPAPATIAQT